MKTLATAALTLTLAACGQSRDNTPGLDTDLLDKQFAILAERAQPGLLNAGVTNLETGSSWSWNADQAMPMQSVFKAILGAVVLARVDERRLSLGEVITIEESDLSPGYSPVAAAFPGRAAYTVDELLTAAVSNSDNTAADVLMRRIGGPGMLTAWLDEKAIRGVRVDRYERELQMEIAGLPSFRPAWVDPALEAAALNAVPEAERRAAVTAYLADNRDTATTEGMLDFLTRLQRGQLLSAASTAKLLAIMTATRSGPARLRAGLPSGAILAHKTGTSGTYFGMTPATNDVGLVTLGNGRRYAVVVFLRGSQAPQAEREALIAETSRLVVRAVK